MKKRIGTKVYDTATAELLCPIEGGHLYQKRTRDREYFAVMNDGTVRPLDVYDPMDVLLMETGKMPEREEPDSPTIMIRVDRETHAKIAQMAKVDGCSITSEVKKIVSLYRAD